MAFERASTASTLLGRLAFPELGSNSRFQDYAIALRIDGTARKAGSSAHGFPPAGVGVSPIEYRRAHARAGD